MIISLTISIRSTCFGAIISPILRNWFHLILITSRQHRRCFYTIGCKPSLELLKMGEILARNMLSWLKFLIKLSLLHLVGCLYYYINNARSHKHQRDTGLFVSLSIYLDINMWISQAIKFLPFAFFCFFITNLFFYLILNFYLTNVYTIAYESAAMRTNEFLQRYSTKKPCPEPQRASVKQMSLRIQVSSIKLRNRT